MFQDQDFYNFNYETIKEKAAKDETEEIKNQWLRIQYNAMLAYPLSSRNAYQPIGSCGCHCNCHEGTDGIFAGIFGL